MIARWASAFVAVLAAVPVAAAVPAAPPAPVVFGRFAPRDDCRAQPGAEAFLASLVEAVARRDAGALAALAEPEVELDFGGGAGRDELRQRLAGTRGEELWRALAALPPLGCAVQGGELVLPWFFAQDLGSDDAYDRMLVTGADLPLRAEPRDNATVVARLSWTLVEPLGGYDAEARFQHVRVADEQGGASLTGFVETANLRSPIDYRLVAARDGEGWRITAFIAGD